MTAKKLTIEILSGPCDGSELVLEANADWNREGSGALAFPWDVELGTPQGYLTVDEQGWWLEPVKSAHGTYHVSKGEKVQDKVELAKDDIFKASRTWLLAKDIE